MAAEQTTTHIKENSQTTHARMKHYADKKRNERTLVVVTWYTSNAALQAYNIQYTQGFKTTLHILWPF